MARAMVTQYGMSDKVGMIHYGSDEDEVFIGRDLAHTRNYAEETAALIDSEVKRIIDESYACLLYTSPAERKNAALCRFFSEAGRQFLRIALSEGLSFRIRN